MAHILRTESICTLNWINKKALKSENDGDGPPDKIPGALVTREDDALPFRFVNLLEAKVLVTESSPPRIISAGWTPASRIYKNPSFGKFASEAFDPMRTINNQHDRVVFQQTVGARTVSPEKFGEIVGALEGPPILIPITEKIGRKVAHALMGFPPIWTTIQLTMFADGRSEGKVLRYSLFPSMSFYTHPDESMGQPRISSSYQLVGDSYDAVQELDDWKVHGWGSLQNGSGPCKGNPWGYSKDDLTIRPVAAETRIV